MKLRENSRVKAILVAALFVLVLSGVVYAADYPTARTPTINLYSDIHGSNTQLDDEIVFDVNLTSPQRREVEVLNFSINPIRRPQAERSPYMVFILNINGTEYSSLPPLSFGTASISSTTAGAMTNISRSISSIHVGDVVSGYIPSWNNSGQWTNSSFVPVNSGSTTAVLLGVLNSTDRAKVQVKFYANNSLGAWSVSDVSTFTAISTSVTLTPPPPIEPPPEPPIVGSTVYLDLYFNGGLHTVNNVTGYAALESASAYSGQADVAAAGNNSVSWGFRVYKIEVNSEVELTSGSPAAVMTATEAEGSVDRLFNATLSLPETSLRFGESALKFVLYSGVNGSDWTPQAVFVTNELFYRSINAGSATVYLYIEKYEQDGVTYSTAYWGDLEHLSGLIDLSMKAGAANNWQSYYLGRSNFLGFLIAPYTVMIGNLFYALILFGVGMSLYIRYRTLSIVTLMVVLLGGGGGLINLLIGDVYVGFVWIVIAFGLGLVYWRVFR